MMKRKLFNALPVLTLLCLLSAVNKPAFSGTMIPVGSTLPDFKMNAPVSKEGRVELGVREDGTFRISDLSAKLIVVEFFSTFCPKCHAHAPVAESLYKLIQGDPELRKVIKMLAVALGNQPDTVVAFSKKFNVTFPLVADPEGLILVKTGIAQVPQTLLIDKEGKVLATHYGVIHDLDGFLREIRAELKKMN